MKSLIIATTLLAGALAVPFAAGAATYAPVAPTVSVQETQRTQKIDVQGPSYRGPVYHNPLQRFLSPRSYGQRSRYDTRRGRHDTRHGRYDKDRHHRTLSDRERYRRWDERYRPDEDFDVQEWNRNAKQRHHSR